MQEAELIVIDGEEVMTEMEAMQLGQWRDEHPHANGGVTVSETAALVYWFTQRPGYQNGLKAIEEMEAGQGSIGR